jgi:hypothetical protein
MKKIRAFVSYSTRDKKIAADVKTALTDLGLTVFVAHDDLRITDEWKAKILEELEVAQVFVPLLSKEFKQSDWAPQELGYAVAKKQLIVPLQVDQTVPFGFISHLQGKHIPPGSPVELFLDPLVAHFPRPTLQRQVERLSKASNFRGAEALMKPLVPHFKKFTAALANHLADICIANGQVWDADLCKTDYLPRFLKVNGKRMAADRKSQLEEKIGIPRNEP